MDNHQSGYVAVNGYRLFCETFGTGGNILLCLHGGPGAPHDYLLSLAKLGDDKIGVDDPLSFFTEIFRKLGAKRDLEKSEAKLAARP